MHRRAQLVEDAQPVEAARGVRVVDGDGDEELVDRLAQMRQRAHGALEVLVLDMFFRVFRGAFDFEREAAFLGL